MARNTWKKEELGNEMAAKSMEDIAQQLKQLRFKKKIFGGVRELDVWRKLEQLHQQYQGVFAVQQALYEQRLADKDARIAQLEARLAASEPLEEL